MLLNVQKEHDLSLLLNATDELKQTAVPELEINLKESNLTGMVAKLRDTVANLPQLLVETKGALFAAAIVVGVRDSVMVYHLIIIIIIIIIIITRKHK